MIYTTTDFDGQQTTDYTLLIGLGGEIQQLAVVDRDRQLKFAASYDSANAAPEATEILAHAFAAVRIAVADCRYTFIPADVYDEQRHETYRHYLPFDGVGEMRVDHIDPLDVKLLYQTNYVGLEDLIARFPHAKYYPHVRSLISAVAAQGVDSSQPLMVVERHACHITVVLFDKNTFLYGHDFECTTEDDFTYHLLSVLHQFGLTDRQPVILLAGDVEQGDGYHDRASAYGGKTILADSGTYTGVGLPADAMSHKHRFLSLFGLYQCES
ncbi:DUF3822 family protein [Parapedobacter sp.]